MLFIHDTPLYYCVLAEIANIEICIWQLNVSVKFHSHMYAIHRVFRVIRTNYIFEIIKHRRYKIELCNDEEWMILYTGSFKKYDYLLFKSTSS